MRSLTNLVDEKRIGLGLRPSHELRDILELGGELARVLFARRDEARLVVNVADGRARQGLFLALLELLAEGARQNGLVHEERDLELVFPTRERLDHPQKGGHEDDGCVDAETTKIRDQRDPVGVREKTVDHDEIEGLLRHHRASALTASRDRDVMTPGAQPREHQLEEIVIVVDEKKTSLVRRVLCERGAPQQALRPRLNGSLRS